MGACSRLYQLNTNNPLSKKELSAEDQEIRRLFDHYDKDKSGTIDKNELVYLLKDCSQKLGRPEPSQEIVDITMKGMDCDKDGKITFEEYKKFIKMALELQKNLRK